MATEAASEQITGQTWTIRQVFTGRRYRLDSYQREYAWERGQVTDLINDLTSRFRRHWSPEHELRDAEGYAPYFLGPIITYRKNADAYLVDGQQRLTTMTLLMIWLSRLQDGRDDAVHALSSMIYSEYFGEKSFAIDEPERQPCLTALLHGAELDLHRATRSVRNLWERYGDIEAAFPEDLRDEELPFFIYWLLDRVTVVEISTRDAPLALEIFETMNDRGLRLTSLDLLKSFVLSQVDRGDVEQVNQVWRQRITDLVELGQNAHSDFVKSWLRAKHARTAKDHDDISGAYDKWVRESPSRMGLKRPADFRDLVMRDMNRLASRYRELLQATTTYTLGLESVYHNAFNQVTLQFPLILAAVSPGDDDETFRRKARMVAGYLDIYVARSMVNAHDFRYDAVVSRMYALAREIRDLDPDTLAKRLGEEVAAMPDTFDAVGRFSLKQRNRSYVKYLLCRMAAWLDQQCGTGHSFADYATPGKERQSFEIEHVWADRPEYYPELPPRRFAELRSRFGALVLLPKDVNASLGGLAYQRKLPQYMGQNLLARSLHPGCYQNNPALRRLMERLRLPFEPFPDEFAQASIESRQRLYQRLCHLVWDPAEYGLVVPDAPKARVVRSKRRSKAHFDVTLAQLVEHGLLPAGGRLVGEYKGEQFVAELTGAGRIRIDTGEEFESPSPAAMAVLERASWNGWTFWCLTNADGSTTRLTEIRQRALKSRAMAGNPDLGSAE